MTFPVRVDNVPLTETKIVRRLSRDQCVALVGPYKEKFFRVGSIPFSIYRAEFPRQELMSPRTRANIINDLMVTQARVEFRGERGAVFVEAPYNVTLMVLEEKALFRFKLIDDEGFPSNYPTDRAEDYQAG